MVAGELVTKDMEKDEVFNAFFASFSTDKTGLQESWGSQSKRKIWSRKYSPSVEEVQVQEHLNKLGIAKSMGAGGGRDSAGFMSGLDDLRGPSQL